MLVCLASVATAIEPGSRVNTEKNVLEDSTLAVSPFLIRSSPKPPFCIFTAKGEALTTENLDVGVTIKRSFCFIVDNLAIDLACVTT